MAIILAIDEDVVLTMSLDLQLGHVGHTVRRAGNMTQVHQLLNEIRPDLIVIDPSIDGNAGWQVISEKAKLIPVFITMHEPTDEIVARAMQLGCAGLIPKPFMMKELIDILLPLITPKSPPAKTESDSDATSTKKSTGKTSKTRTRGTKIDDKGTTTPAENLTQTTGDSIGLSLSSEDELMLAGLPSTTLMTPDTSQSETLGARLRASRNRRSIPLTQAELNTSVRLTYLQAMEEDRFSHLPRGAMAEEMITKYAKYLGVNVEEAIAEYRSFQYGDRHDPITDYGRANLRIISYANAVKVIVAMLILAGIGYGIWYVDQPRVTAFINNTRQIVMPLFATRVPNPTPTSTPTVTPTPAP